MICSAFRHSRQKIFGLSEIIVMFVIVINPVSTLSGSEVIRIFLNILKILRFFLIIVYICSMKRLFGIVSSDVVDSTSLERAAIIQFRKDIYDDLFRDLTAKFPSFWGRVVRGDTIECCVSQAQYSFRVALLAKCWVKNWAESNWGSPSMCRLGLRCSIGIGKMRIVDKEEDLLDGDAVYIAGRNLDYISRKNIPVAFGMNTAYTDVEALIINNLLLLDTLLYSLTSRQSDVLYYKLMGYHEMEIARMLGLSQTAVNLRSKNAGWQQIRDTLNILENINYGNYVD